MIKKACQALCVSIFLIIGCGQDNSRTGDTASGEPTVRLPFEVALPDGYGNDKVIIEESTISAPPILDKHYAPVGKVYNIELEGHAHAEFGDSFAQLSYSYDRVKLYDEGLTEQFRVYYFDETDNAWKQVDSIRVDADQGRVTAYTSHFTPFVLTALTDPWIQVGPSVNNDTTLDISSSQALAFSGTTPYVAWIERDESNAYDSAYVKYFDGIRWIQLGGDILEPFDNNTISNGLSLSISRSIPFLAFVSCTGSMSFIHVLKWTGNNWETVGDPINYHLKFSLSLKVYNGTPYIVEAENENDAETLYVLYYNGNVWKKLGGAVTPSAGWFFYPTLYINQGIPYVAYFEKGTNEIFGLYVRHWNGTEWINDGDNLQQDPAMRLEEITPPSMSFDKSIPYITWTETNRHPDIIKNFEANTIPRATKIYCKYFDGASWVNVGDHVNNNVSDVSYQANMTIVKGKPYVVFTEKEINENIVEKDYNIYVRSWDGVQWKTLGETLNPPLGSYGVYNPTIVFNGLTCYVAYEYFTEARGTMFPATGAYLLVKAGNWNEPIVDTSVPRITKFELTSKPVTADRIVTFNLEGTDDKGITGWMITGTDVQPYLTNFNWQSEKPTQCEVDKSSGKTQLYIWAKDADGNVSEACDPVEVDFFNVSMETASNQYYGSGTFGDPSKPLTKDDYPIMTPLLEGIDYAYNSALNNTDNQGYSIYDPNNWLNFDDGRYFRIVENGKNVTASDGLNLTPIAKNLENIDKSFPPKNEVWIDPARNRFVFPRPRYFDKFDDEINKSNNLILTNAILSDENTKIIESPLKNGLLNGTYNITTSNEGKFNKCLQFSITSHYHKQFSTWERMSYSIYPFGSIPKNYDSGTISFWHYGNGEYSSPNQVATFGGFSIWFYNGSIEVVNGAKMVFYLQAGLVGGANASNTSISLWAAIYVTKPDSLSQSAVSDIIFVSRNQWHHYYLIWDVNRRLNNNTKTVRLFVDGIEVISMNNLFNASNFTCMIDIDAGAYNRPAEFTGISRIDNLKFWDYVVSENSSWEYNNGYGNENGIHAMYKNCGVPTLNIENNSGVGYYKAQ